MRTSNVTFQLRKLYLDTSFSRETTSLVNCSMDVNAIAGQLMAVSRRLAKAMFGEASQPCVPTAEKRISASLKKGMQRRKRPDADRDHLQSIIQHVRDCDPAN
jgi:hypothetical protein